MKPKFDTFRLFNYHPLLCLILFLGLGMRVSVCQSLSVDWIQSYGGTEYDGLSKILPDGLGHVYLVGSFRDTVDFDPGATVYNLFGSQHSNPIVAKFDTNGTLIWAKHFSCTFLSGASEISIDQGGNLHITGAFKGTADFDPGPGVYSLSSSASGDRFMVKLTPNGDFILARKIGNYNSGGRTLSRAVFDTDGNIYFCGNIFGTCDVDPGPSNFSLGCQGASDGFLLKLDSNYSFKWVKRIGGYSAERANEICIDNAGHIYLVGGFLDSLDLDLGPGTNFIYNSSSLETTGFVMKLDTSGSTIWGKGFQGTGDLYINDISLDPANAIYLSGILQDTVDFDPDTSSYFLHSNSGSQDGFLAKLDNNGNFAWARVFGENQADHCNSVVADAQYNVFVAGKTGPNVDLDPSPLNLQLNGAGPFVLRLDSAGNYIKAMRFPATIGEKIGSIAYEHPGNVYISGTFHQPISIPYSGGAATITSNGSADAFYGRLTYCTNFTTKKIDTSACDSFSSSLSISPLTTSAVYNSILQNAQGCDSIVSLHLTIVNHIQVTDTIESCEHYTWINGTTYTSNNNIASDTFINSSGCDSIVFLDLTIHHPDSITQIIAACDSYTWTDGISYTASNNTASQLLTNSNGCDSIVTLDLTVFQSTSAVDAITACDSLTWVDGNIYYASNNTPTYILTNNAGCDSTINLNLTINHSDSTSQSITACDSYAWIDGNTYTSSNNTATHILTNTAGCDSVITLDLTINQSSSGTDVIQVCDSITWIDGITYTSSNNSATYTLTNAAGCDSIVTLDLTIQSTSSTDTVSSCDSYTWIDGVTYAASNNTATYVTTNAAGCDSTIYLNLTIDTVNTGVNISGATLTAEVTEANYQWLACDSAGNFSMLPNDTNQSFTPTQNGEYALRIVKNGCKDTSECISVNNVGFNEQNPFDQVSIFPNPTLGTLNIDLGSISTAQVRVLNAVGQVIVQQTEINRSSNQVRIDGAAGVYFLEVSVNGEAKRFRVVKE